MNITVTDVQEQSYVSTRTGLESKSLYIKTKETPEFLGLCHKKKGDGSAFTTDEMVAYLKELDNWKDRLELVEGDRGQYYIVNSAKVERDMKALGL